MTSDLLALEVGEFNSSFCPGDGEVDTLCLDALTILPPTLFWDPGVGEFPLTGALKKPQQIK